MSKSLPLIVQNTFGLVSCWRRVGDDDAARVRSELGASGLLLRGGGVLARRRMRATGGILTEGGLSESRREKEKREGNLGRYA